MSSNVYDFELPASIGASILLNVSGSKCVVTSAPAGLIEITTDTGKKYKLLEGQGFTLPPGQEFRWLAVRNLQAVANSGLIFVGDDYWVDNRTTGSVNVVDGERQKVLDGYAFRGVGTVTVGTGVPLMSLHNPAGSGKNCYVQSLVMSHSLADSYTIVRGTNALGTNLGAGTNIDPLSSVSNALIRSDNTGAAVAGSAPLLAGYVVANETRTIQFARPILLRPGYGVFVAVAVVAGALKVSFEWEEWPV